MFISTTNADANQRLMLMENDAELKPTPWQSKCYFQYSMRDATDIPNSSNDSIHDVERSIPEVRQRRKHRCSYTPQENVGRNARKMPTRRKRQEIRRKRRKRRESIVRIKLRNVCNHKNTRNIETNDAN